MDKVALKSRALQVWRRHRGRDTSPTQDERDVLVQAYYAGVLPRDPDFSVSQWVEDGCPPLS